MVACGILYGDKPSKLHTCNVLPQSKRAWDSEIEISVALKVLEGHQLRIISMVCSTSPAIVTMLPRPPFEGTDSMDRRTFKFQPCFMIRACIRASKSSGATYICGTDRFRRLALLDNSHIWNGHLWAVVFQGPICFFLTQLLSSLSQSLSESTLETVASIFFF